MLKVSPMLYPQKLTGKMNKANGNFFLKVGILQFRLCSKFTGNHSSSLVTTASSLVTITVNTFGCLQRMHAVTA